MRMREVGSEGTQIPFLSFLYSHLVLVPSHWRVTLIGHLTWPCCWSYCWIC